MKPEIKQKWVAALRSGEYGQTKHHLRDGGGFCCLGVLCDLHSKETGSDWVGGFYFGSRETLPPEVIEWSGVVDYNPSVGDTDLAGMNDGGKDFVVIADIIESQL